MYYIQIDHDLSSKSKRFFSDDIMLTAALAILFLVKIFVSPIFMLRNIDSILPVVDIRVSKSAG